MDGKLNQKLAIVARETGLAIATGSISAGLRHPEFADSYKIVREENPNGLVFANLRRDMELRMQNEPSI